MAGEVAKTKNFLGSAIKVAAIAGLSLSLVGVFAGAASASTAFAAPAAGAETVWDTLTGLFGDKVAETGATAGANAAAATSAAQQAASQAAVTAGTPAL